MDFQESPPVHNHQQEQPPTPHDPPSPQTHQQEQQQPPLHGHVTMAVPQPPHQPQTHQQEHTNSNILPEKIIFHQPQQQKKRGRPKKSFAEGLGLSPTLVFEAFGAYSSENPSKKSRGRPIGCKKKQKSQALDSGVDGDVTGVASSVIPLKKFVGRSMCCENKQKQQALGAVESRWTPHLISVQAGEGGQFDIISLSGSLFLPDSNDNLGISSGLSVLLSRPDGSNIGGSVAGLLKASSPVELVVGSFLPEKEKPMPEEPSSAC